MIELLAPAKDKKCAIAAIDCGADAVYIGASEFGARKNVPNSLADIKEVVNYAHKFNVKVYITLNTILTDDEIEKAKKLIIELEKIGVDAIIIQDMGLIEPSPLGTLPSETLGECFRRDKGRVRGISYHASTQCDNRTPEKVKFLESVGFSRVVLARELSIEQIKEIKKQTNVELETFIHGALCVSYSGQCYMSQMIGGRSANRGECAQPCRKKYSLVDEEGNYVAKDKYLLCLKDFNASKHIKKLSDAGVTSFKIEGRLKDENYVKNVVAYYRKLIDNLGLKKTSSGNVLLDFEPNLEKSFNRGFTDYFLEKRKNCFNFESPKSRGEYIGKVSKIGKDYFEIAESPPPLRGRVREGGKGVYPQDGLCFLAQNELRGFRVNKVDNNKIYPNAPHLNLSSQSKDIQSFDFGRVPQGGRKNNYDEFLMGIKVGTEIYRNFDSEFEKQLKNSKTCRKIGVNIEFDLGNIKAVDEDKNITEIDYSFDELAQNTEKMSENIINQFKKSGETAFLVEDVKILSDKIPFLPVSKLNELRRELLEKLAARRQEGWKAGRQVEINCSTYRPIDLSTLDYKANILNQSAKEFYENLGFEVSEMALESGKTSKVGKVAMTCKHCLKFAFDLCKSPKHLFLIDEKNKRYELKFNCDKCEMEIIF